MFRIAQVYLINAAAFATNMAAVLFYSRTVGAAGYGTYSIYVSFMSIYMLVDVAIVKAAIFVFERERVSGSESDAYKAAVSFLNWAFLPLALVSSIAVILGNILYPEVSGQPTIGGGILLTVAAVENLASYPSNRLSVQWSILGKYRSVFGWRLLGAVLRHLISWTVLLTTGSLLLAICSIVLRGAIFGAFSALWVRSKYSLSSVRDVKPNGADFALLAHFLSTSFSLILLYEVPTFYINQSYGREAVGVYKILYDVSNAIWFIATIFPTVLIKYLLELKNNTRTVIRLIRIDFIICAIHLLYFCVVLLILFLFDAFGFLVKLDLTYGVGVVAGICLLGYNRFLIEVGQSFELERNVVVIALVSLFVTAASLYFSGKHDQLEVAFAWVFGQLIFLFGLKALLFFKVPRVILGYSAFVMVGAGAVLYLSIGLNSAAVVISLAAGIGFAALCGLLLGARKQF